MEQRTLTGQDDADITILNHLDDKSLFSACRVDKRLMRLCHDDRLWRRRIQDRLRRPDLLQGKPEDISWRDWYFFWSKHHNNPIPRELGLDNYQSMIEILTQQGQVYYGSEKFITLDLALKRAFRSRDYALISYFKDLFNEMILQRNDRKSPITAHYKGSTDYKVPIPPSYADAVIAAIENGYDSDATTLLNHMLIYLGDLRDEDAYYKIVQTLGKYNLDELYRRFSDGIREKLNVSSEKLRDYYLIGLLAGRHNNEALASFGNYLHKFAHGSHMGEFIDLVKAIHKNNNYEAIDILEEKLLIPKYGIFGKKYLDTIIGIKKLDPQNNKIWLKYPDKYEFFHLPNNYPKIFLDRLKSLPENELVDVNIGETCYQPLLDFALEHRMIVNVDYRKCSAKTIEKYFNNQKFVDTIIKEGDKWIGDIIISARYDLLPLLPFITDKLGYDSEDFVALVYLSLTTRNKDIVMYMLILYFKIYMKDDDPNKRLDEYELDPLDSDEVDLYNPELVSFFQNILDANPKIGDLLSGGKIIYQLLSLPASLTYPVEL